MTEIWTFKKDPNGLWAWQRQAPGKEAIQSAAKPFKAFADCVRDAQRFGYVGSDLLPAEPKRDAAGRIARLIRR